MLSFYGELLPTINVGDFVGNYVGDFKNGEKDLAVMKITGIIRYEGKDNVGVNPSNCRCKYPSLL
mgnify:CR=1 FL=1